MYTRICNVCGQNDAQYEYAALKINGSRQGFVKSYGSMDGILQHAIIIYIRHKSLFARHKSSLSSIQLPFCETLKPPLQNQAICIYFNTRECIKLHVAVHTIKIVASSVYTHPQLYISVLLYYTMMQTCRISCIRHTLWLTVTSGMQNDKMGAKVCKSILILIQIFKRVAGCPESNLKLFVWQLCLLVCPECGASYVSRTGIKEPKI